MNVEYTQSNYQVRVHIAGEPDGMRQSCSRCGHVLCDFEGAMSTTEHAMLFWATGSFIGVTEHIDGSKCNPTGSMMISRDAQEIDEIRCNSRPS